MATIIDAEGKPLETMGSEPKSLLSLGSRFFGRLDGQTVKDFAAEFKMLTDEDKAQLHQGLADGTLTH